MEWKIKLNVDVKTKIIKKIKEAKIEVPKKFWPSICKDYKCVYVNDTLYDAKHLLRSVKSILQNLEAVDNEIGYDLFLLLQPYINLGMISESRIDELSFDIDTSLESYRESKELLIDAILPVEKLIVDNNNNKVKIDEYNNRRIHLAVKNLIELVK